MAKIKQTAKELPKDVFQNKGEEFVAKMSTQVQTQRRNILIGLGVVAGLAVLFGLWTWNSNRKAQQAYDALGKAIKIESAQVTATPPAGSTAPTFPTEKEKAQKAIESFQLAAGYSDPTGAIARYFVAANQIEIDRAQGLSQMQQLTGDKNPMVAVLAKFAVAQGAEADAKYDEAGKLYGELAAANNDVITPETANLRLAHVYDKQGKKSEAVELLFNLVKAARERKDKDNKPIEQSTAAREATQELERLDPKRFSELPKESEGVNG